MREWLRKLAVRAGTSEKNLAAIVASPRFYPEQFTLDDITFIEVTQETYRRSSFLDHRMHREPKRKELLCGTRQLNDYYAGVQGRPVGFIFHVAFCCSTLLARYLESLPGAFVLKEPFLATQLAELNRASIVDPDVARLGVRLMARTFDPRDMAIAKLADQCNAVAPALMSSPDARRAVFMGLELRSFLLAGLKTDQRRAWIRRRAELARQDVGTSPLADTDPKTLGDAEACAYLWMSNGVLLQKLLAGVGRDRLLVIDGESVSDSPGPAVEETARWLGLSPGDADLKAAINDQTAGKYSKDPTQTFTREDRRADLADVYRKFGNEVEAAMSWAGRFAPDLGLDPLSGTMLAANQRA